MLRKIFIVILSFFLFSCKKSLENTINRMVEDVQQKVEGVQQKIDIALEDDGVLLFMDEYFEKVKANDFSLIASHYSETISKEKLEARYNNINLSLGNLISVKRINAGISISSKINTPGESGKYYTLLYYNKYENGDASETFVLFIPRGETKIYINEHDLNL